MVNKSQSYYRYFRLPAFSIVMPFEIDGTDFLLNDEFLNKYGLKIKDDFQIGDRILTQALKNINNDKQIAHLIRIFLEHQWDQFEQELDALISTFPHLSIRAKESWRNIGDALLSHRPMVRRLCESGRGG